MRWPDPPGSPEPLAWFGDCLATGLVDVTSDPAALDSAGWWAVVADFEGGLTCARFADVRSAHLPLAPWQGLDRSAWTCVQVTRESGTEHSVAASTIHPCSGP